MHKQFNQLLSAAALSSFLGLALQAQPTITAGGTVNAADYSRDFAPGAIISIFGTNLAATTGGAVSVPLPTSLGGTSVELVDGAGIQSLPLFYVSPAQINAQLTYGLTAGTAQIRVRTAGGASATDTITIRPRAPKLFTIDFSGAGNGVITDPGFNIATQAGPVKPGDNIILWMNSLGETTPPIVAGNAAPGGPGIPSSAITDPVSVTIGGKAAQVTFVGAAPGYSGLYQVNVRAPFVVATGPLNIQVAISGVTSQASVMVPFRQLGFYNAVLAGKSVSGQTVNGVTALALRGSDPIAYPMLTLNQWVHPGSTSPMDSTVSGEAVTLKNGAGIVFDNNGIEDKSGAAFYSNSGGGPDSQKPGLVNVYSMSNYFPLISGTYIKLSQPATVSEMIAYFDPNGNMQLPFDPNNAYVKYRMNLWSNVSGMPKETGSYVGDVFSSDSTGGTFSVAQSGVNRVSSDPHMMPSPIWRLDYKLNSPITLAAGEYWFSHDASVRDNPTSGTSTSASMTLSELAEIIRMQPQAGPAIKFSFFGREMMYQESWTLSAPVEVRPVSPISIKEFSRSLQ